MVDVRNGLFGKEDSCGFIHRRTHEGVKPKSVGDMPKSHPVLPC